MLLHQTVEQRLLRAATHLLELERLKFVQRIFDGTLIDPDTAITLRWFDATSRFRYAHAQISSTSTAAVSAPPSRIAFYPAPRADCMHGRRSGTVMS
jgi:hypothetical protein